MRHHLVPSPITMSHSKTPNLKKVRSNPNPSCHHSATLDLLILLVVLFSFTFLISSYLSYTLHSLSLLLPPSLDFHFLIFPSLLLLIFIASTCFTLHFFFLSRRCANAACKGLRTGLEFDLRLQGEQCLKGGGKAVREIDDLPWKAGAQGNRDYECLRNELRKMAPVNGRAVLVFQNKCGCPFAKLEGWSVKRKHNKALALKGGGDYR